MCDLNTPKDVFNKALQHTWLFILSFPVRYHSCFQRLKYFHAFTINQHSCFNFFFYQLSQTSFFRRAFTVQIRIN